MRGYYVGKLAGERLRRCYEIAAPRVQRYFAAEIEFVLARLRPGDAVLDLGCGYGRVALPLAKKAGRVVGIDTAPGSIALARELAVSQPNCEFQEMDAAALAFAGATFDVVVCVQNGICAFGVDQDQLAREALRVTRPGGRVLFSTYSERFWPHRLRWFEAQAAAGLVGAIDYDQTGQNTIVCRDGFRTGLMTPAALRALGRRLELPAEVTEVDGSSVFCEFIAPY